MKFLILLIPILSSTNTFAQCENDVSLYWTLHDGGEYFDADRHPDWVVSDNYGYMIQSSLSSKESELPISITTGDYSVSISKEYLVRFQYIFSDADASALTSLTLPTDANNKLLPLIYKLTLEGGDHASGSWEIKGDLNIHINKECKKRES